MQALEESLKKLISVFNQNLQATQRAFSLTDAHFWVLQKICQDLSHDGVKYTQEYLDSQNYEGDNPIDLQAYYQMFNEHQKQKMEIMKKAQEIQKAKAEEKAKAKEEPEQKEEVFGGDLG